MSDSTHKGLISSITVYNERFKIFNAFNDVNAVTFNEDVKQGLTSSPKYLLSKYFYDQYGSELFVKICHTPEYYVTRIETGILKNISDEVAGLNSNKKVLVELGSGSSVKTKYLINSFIKSNGVLKYVPIDVSEIMISSSDDLVSEFEELKIDGILAEYETGLGIAGSVIKEPKMIVFLGSSIGNFNLTDAEKFIRHISDVMNPGDSLLIGFDLVKDTAVLNDAYNDSAQYTAMFNMNLLKRINSELQGEFNLEKFSHNAFFNESQSRIEMHLVSLEEQEICIHAIREKIQFDKDETIHTENSYKFNNDMIYGLASSASLEVEKMWKDDKNYFALCMMRKG